MPKSKGLIIGLVLLSVVMTFASVTFYMGRAAEEKKRQWAESQLEEMLRMKAALEREKDELTKAKTELEIKTTDLDSKVTTLTSQAEQLSQQIEVDRRAAAMARDELTSAQRKAEEATGRLETERREKLAIADELAKAKQDTKRIQDELVQLRQAKEALERRVKEMMGGTSAPDTIVVTPPSSMPTKPGMAPAIGKPSGPTSPSSSMSAPATQALPTAGSPGGGSVLVVNREFNFIVVNLGSRDNMKQGQFLEILRNGKSIAKVQVERIYDNMSAANLLPESTKADVREGDSVRRI